jgi:hypothetical protein
VHAALLTGDLRVDVGTGVCGWIESSGSPVATPSSFLMDINGASVATLDSSGVLLRNFSGGVFPCCASASRLNPGVVGSAECMHAWKGVHSASISVEGVVDPPVAHLASRGDGGTEAGMHA